MKTKVDTTDVRARYSEGHRNRKTSFTDGKVPEHDCPCVECGYWAGPCVLQGIHRDVPVLCDAVDELRGEVTRRNDLDVIRIRQIHEQAKRIAELEGQLDWLEEQGGSMSTQRAELERQLKKSQRETKIATADVERRKRANSNLQRTIKDLAQRLREAREQTK